MVPQPRHDALGEQRLAGHLEQVGDVGQVAALLEQIPHHSLGGCEGLAGAGADVADGAGQWQAGVPSGAEGEKRLALPRQVLAVRVETPVGERLVAKLPQPGRCLAVEP